MKKINQLELLRIIGCLAIVAFHLFRNSYLPSGVPLFSTMKTLTENGQKAVDLFFILSGFFFVYTLNLKISLKDFFVKKLIRLYPVLLFVLFLFVITDPIQLINFDFYTALSAIFGLYGTPLARETFICSPFWYCSSMLWTFILFYYLLKNYETKNVNLFIAVLSFVSYALIMQLHDGILGGPHNTYNGLFNIGLLRAFGGMGVGYFIGLWYKQYKPVTLPSRLKGAFTLVELACLYFIIYQLIFHPLVQQNNMIFVIVFVTTVILFLTKAGYISCLLDTPRLHAFSKYTYSVYMTHTFVFSILHHFIWKNAAQVQAYPYLNIGFALLCAFALGVITYHCVELPCYRWWKNRHNPGSAPSL